MNKSAPWSLLGFSLLTGLLENAALPGFPAGLWLGPALLIALIPVVGWMPLVYWSSMWLGTAIWAIAHPLASVWLVPLHFLLAYAGRRKRSSPLLLLAAAAPLFGNLLFAKADLVYLLGSAVSLLAQWLLAVDLGSRLQARMQAKKKRAAERKAAHAISLAGSVRLQLNKLQSIALEMTKSTDQVYGIYQDVELLIRSNPTLPENLSTRLLGAAQENHQAKLRLAMLSAGLQDSLQALAGKQGATLGELCHWVAAKLEVDAEQLGRTTRTEIQVNDDPSVPLEQQLPLAFLLQSVCQQELRSLHHQQTSVAFTGFATQGKLRVVVNLQPGLGQPSGEWPTLRPIPLGQLTPLAEQLAAQCKVGATSDGQRVITVELG